MMKIAGQSAGIELVAHRGASFDAPENTVTAFRLAWDGNADAVELDVHQTTDDRLVVIHDDNTRRTTGVAGKVDEMTLADVQQLDAGSWKGARFAGEKIPTLEQVFATGSQGKRFFVEIKSSKVSMPLLRASIERAGLGPAQIVIMAFLKSVARAAKEELPRYPVLWLVASPKRLRQLGHGKVSVEQLMAGAEADGLDGLSLNCEWPIDRDFTRKIKSRGLKVYVWTVDDSAASRRFREAGVDGIITNRAGWLREQLANSASLEST
jgi:glycerophosphoryl diester phosphodiesterase